MSVSISSLLRRKTQADQKADKKEGSAIGSMRLLARFMMDQRRLFYMAILMLVLEAFTAVQLPLLTGFVVNYFFNIVKRQEWRASPRAAFGTRASVDHLLHWASGRDGSRAMCHSHLGVNHVSNFRAR